MRKTDPKLIVNVTVKDEELEEKVKIAVEEYIDKIVQSEELNNIINKYIDSRVTRSLDDYIYQIDAGYHTPKRAALDKKVDEIIENIVDKKIKQKILEELVDKFNISIKEDKN